jgi:anthranilate synthase component 1
MKGPRLAAGDILPLVRRLSGAPDAPALFGALTGEAGRPDTLLLESADAASGQGEKSILIPRTMLRIEGRGRRVRITPLTPNGRTFRDWLASALDPALGQARDGDHLLVEYPAALPGGEEQSRLRQSSPLDVLRTVTFRPNLVSEPAALSHLAAGIFAYDLVEAFETLPPARQDPLGFPDFVFWIPEQVIVLDHVHRATTIMANVIGGDDPDASYHDAVRAVETLSRAVEAGGRTGGPAGGESDGLANRQYLPACPPARLPARVDLDDANYADLVRQLKRNIVAGDVFQIVPSRTFTLPCSDPFAAYRRLRAANPSPYMFLVRSPGWTLLGASPETAVKVTGRPARVTLRPIAGTAPRGRSPDGRLDQELDARLQAALLTDAKELAEHMMLVDLARNDVARVSRAGTRRVSRLLTVDHYQHVMHIVSEVEGELAPGLDALHAYTASMNMGTLVGAPKIRAAELLREHEPSRRGPYGGAVGYLTHSGEMDTAIVIRSALVQDGMAHVRAGAGVVLDSDPDREAEETRRKAASVLAAVAGAEP